MKSVVFLSVALAAQVSGFQAGVPSLTIVQGKAALVSTAVSGPTKPAALVLQNHPQATRLFAASTTDNNSEDEGGATAVVAASKLDVDAIVKYVGALAVQMGLFTGLFAGLDFFVAALGVKVPFALNFVFFYFFALKSRFLNPLQNSRPQVATKEIENAQERKMPSWTPPGFIFPIVWLLLIGPLRAATTSMIYKAAGGSYCNGAILSLMMHLSIGDIWNTINNVERRYGTSVLGMICVYTSAAFAAFQYSKVLPLAGKLLSLKLIWLTIASSLIVQTWRLNPNPKTGKKFSLLPKTGEGSKTEFSWFSE